MPDAVAVVSEALRGTGLNVAASCSVEAYDRRAPAGYRSSELMPRARGVVVAASAGRELWDAVRLAGRDDPVVWTREHPLDAFVARVLDRADEALALARIGSRRFEARVDAHPMLDFRAMGELVGLGSTGPFGLVIHPEHGPWWALRAAWLVDQALPDPASYPAPCAGCHAPCVEGAKRTPEGILLATVTARVRCVVGQGARYSDEQLSYHYDRDATLARLRAP
jgi:epoxyqueuosine reductase QueG